MPGIQLGAIRVLAGALLGKGGTPTFCGPTCCTIWHVLGRRRTCGTKFRTRRRRYTFFHRFCLHRDIQCHQSITGTLAVWWEVPKPPCLTFALCFAVWNFSESPREACTRHRCRSGAFRSWTISRTNLSPILFGGRGASGAFASGGVAPWSDRGRGKSRTTINSPFSLDLVLSCSQCILSTGWLWQPHTLYTCILCPVSESFRQYKRSALLRVTRPTHS